MTSVFALECPPVATWCYMVSSPDTGTAYVIDAPYQSAQQVLAEAERLGVRITDILLTHTHWDHTADCQALQQATRALKGAVGHTVRPGDLRASPEGDPRLGLHAVAR